MDWKEILYMSALIWFNGFCIMGTVLSVYAIFVLAKINQHSQITLLKAQEKMDFMEANFSDWGKFVIPAIGLLSSFKALNRKKNSVKSFFQSFWD